MIPTQTLISFPEFSNSGSKVAPDDAKYAAGFAASDVLPAEWLNYFLNKSSAGQTAINTGLKNVEEELNSVLTAGGVTADATKTNQVQTAIKNQLDTKSPLAGSSDLTTCSEGTFGAAATKGVDTELSSESTNVPTTKAVNDALGDYSKKITYSTDEVDTGNTWIDGKKIYRKTINFTTVAYGTYQFITTSIPDCNEVCYYDGYITGSNNFLYPINWHSNDDSYVFTDISKDATQLYNQVNATVTANCSAYMLVYYTKTTD